MKQVIWFRCYEYSTTQIKFFECNGAKNFHDLVYDVKTRHHNNPSHFIFYAEFSDGYRLKIPRELYAYPPVPASQLEAGTFIAHRTISINSDKDAIFKSKIKNQKIERCFYKDNFQEQLQDYIATAPWEWRKESELIHIRFTRENFQCNCGLIPQSHSVALLFSIENNNVRKLCDGKIVVI